MRTIWKFPLPLATEITSYVVDMPRGARVLWFGLQGMWPTIWALVDDQAPQVPRRFVTVGTGHDVGEFTAEGYVGSYEQGLFVWHVFEAQHADPLPERIAALPIEAQNAYRVLRKAGYEMAPEGAPYTWISHSGEPVTMEIMLAVGELAEHGLGSVSG